VVAAVLSSYHDIALPKEICFSAEIGLSGELRPVSKLDQRISESQKLGFETIITSKGGKNKSNDIGINFLALTKIEEVVALLFA
jgi:DNA repair protein RadA/Sms